MKPFEFASLDSTDVAVALAAASAMAERFDEPMCIMQGLEVIKLSKCNEPPLEIIYPKFWGGDRGYTSK